MRIFLAIIFFCSVSAIADTFTYDIQQAGYKFDQYDLNGTATLDIFKNEFRSFPWKNQVGNNKGGTEPTIYVRNHDTKIDLWVSVVGNPEDFSYLLGIIQPKKVSTFFGFGTEKEIRWISAYIFEKPEWVEEAFELYFQGKTDLLNSRLGNLPIYLEQEAMN